MLLYMGFLEGTMSNLTTHVSCKISFVEVLKFFVFLIY